MGRGVTRSILAYAPDVGPPTSQPRVPSRPCRVRPLAADPVDVAAFVLALAADAGSGSGSASQTASGPLPPERGRVPSVR